MISLFRRKKMNHNKRLFLPVLIALVLVAFAVGLAQTGQPSNQKQQTEACCAMDSCCCKSDSCDMKTAQNADGTSAGCCGGASCDMQKHDSKNGGEKGCCCCSSDSCPMTAQHDANHPAAKRDCCSGAMATNMTAKHEVKNHDKKNHDMKNGCCCCSDSCEMKVKQAGS